MDGKARSLPMACVRVCVCVYCRVLLEVESLTEVHEIEDIFLEAAVSVSLSPSHC